MNRELICKILSSEMSYATGCTEPAAIALCCAYAKKYLNEDVEELTINASVNIIKNAMAAGIPGTKRTGIDMAGAIGAVTGNCDSELLVMDRVSNEDIDKATQLVANNRVKVNKVDSKEKLYIEAIASGNDHSAKTVIASAHTNLVYAAKDGEVILDNPIDHKQKGIDSKTISDTLSIESILEFVDTIAQNNDDLSIIDKAIEINTSISKEGLNNKYNLAVGQNVNEMIGKRIFGESMVSSIIKETSAGIDARMGGANHPVVTNSGSGNQGITCTIPVLVAGRYLNKDEKTTYKAVVLSHLMCIYIHCNFGLLSALCGATIASTASACAITYLLGGREKQISYTINNMLGSVSGMLCDGAKPDCAMKVATCLNIACISSYMAMNDISVKSNEGIVEKDAVDTVNNFIKLSDECSNLIDNTVLEIMLNKK